MNSLYRNIDNKTFLSVLIFVIFFICQCDNNEIIPPKIINGYIDISEWNFKVNGDIKLKGEWRYKFNFSEENFLNIDFNNPALQKLIVPGYWNSKENESFGYCILKLKVKNNINEKLAIHIEYSNTAYELYINNELYHDLRLFRK